VLLKEESGHFPWLDEPERFFHEVPLLLAGVAPEPA
jgi:hypothetical protein